MSESNNKSMDEAVKEFINALGAISEISLIFYRNVLNAGATTDEAFKLTQAFIAANIFGNIGRNTPGK